MNAHYFDMPVTVMCVAGKRHENVNSHIAGGGKGTHAVTVQVLQHSSGQSGGSLGPSDKNYLGLESS